MARPRLLLACLLAAFLAPTSALPSFVMMLCDDCGWGDFGFQGTGTNVAMTPNIDAMAFANSSIRLTRYHTEITCTPSRTSLITGRFPLRDCCVGAPIGNKPIWGPVSSSVVKIAQNAGYQTIQLGKWQEANNTELDSAKWPSAQGFTQWNTYDHGSTYDLPCMCFSPQPSQCFRGHQPLGLINEDSKSQGATYGRNWGRPCLLGNSPNNQVEQFPRHQLDSERITDLAINFLQKSDQTRPVYVYMAFRSVHVPYVASPAYRNLCSMGNASSICYNGPSLSSRQLDYFGCVHGIDVAVGRMRQALRQYRADWEDTILVFSSDNGPESPQHDGAGSTGGLRGWKRDLFEGGIRLPFVLEWPKMITQNLVSTALTTIEDIPTTMELLITGNMPHVQRDGINLVDVINNPSTYVRPTPHIVCSYVSPSQANTGTICPTFCVIDPTGTWKLMVSRSNPSSTSVGNLIVTGLYNIPANETKNLASAYPKQVKVMLAMAQQWIKGIFKDFQNNCPGYYGKHAYGGSNVAIWEPPDVLWSTPE